MSNSTPPTPPSEDHVRAAQAALNEQGWEIWTPGCWWQGELAVGRSADGAYEASLWTGPNAEPGTPWLCDVGATPPDAEKKALWLYGIPRPEEVPALLERHADILSVGVGDYVLDLASGEIILSNVAQQLQAVSPSDVTPSQRRADAFREAIRILGEIGLSVRDSRPDAGGEPDGIIV